MVVSSGLQEFRAHEASSDISATRSKRRSVRCSAPSRSRPPNSKRGLSGSRDDRFHGPVRGSVRNGVRHHQRVPRHEERRSRLVSRQSPAVFRKRCLPPRSDCSWQFPAVWLFNYFTGKVDGFVVEMDNSASELVDYFIKNRTKQLKA
jgi:biopolymer transport protein ExbB/biopolymer transport protein TolQ